MNRKKSEREKKRKNNFFLEYCWRQLHIHRQINKYIHQDIYDLSRTESCTPKKEKRKGRNEN